MGALSRWGWNALSRVGVDLVSDDFLTRYRAQTSLEAARSYGTSTPVHKLTLTPQASKLVLLHYATYDRNQSRVKLAEISPK